MAANILDDHLTKTTLQNAPEVPPPCPQAVAGRRYYQVHPMHTSAWCRPALTLENMR
jgi:hypothetical protein